MKKLTDFFYKLSVDLNNCMEAKNKAISKSEFNYRTAM